MQDFWQRYSTRDHCQHCCFRHQWL